MMPSGVAPVAATAPACGRNRHVQQAPARPLRPLRRHVALVGVGPAPLGPALYRVVDVLAGQGPAAARANGSLIAARRAGGIAGPLLGGVLVAAVGTNIVLLLDAGSF